MSISKQAEAMIYKRQNQRARLTTINKIRRGGPDKR